LSAGNATPPEGRLDARFDEAHRSTRIGWLRAAVLGANDGIVSTASLMVGVAAASATPNGILLTGVAGLVAGAMSMAAGEYVSVHSQKDTENADRERERQELLASPATELAELAAIYVGRGVSPELALQVAVQLTAADAIGAHARDELGLSSTLGAKPLQAALASAASFTVGAALPLAVAFFVPGGALIYAIAATSLAFLAALGVLAARAGGADVWTSAWRVTFWGGMAMAITAAAGKLFGAAV